MGEPLLGAANGKKWEKMADLRDLFKSYSLVFVYLNYVEQSCYQAHFPKTH